MEGNCEGLQSVGDAWKQVACNESAKQASSKDAGLREQARTRRGQREEGIDQVGDGGAATTGNPGLRHILIRVGRVRRGKEEEGTFPRAKILEC